MAAPTSCRKWQLQYYLGHPSLFINDLRQIFGLLEGATCHPKGWSMLESFVT